MAIFKGEIPQPNLKETPSQQLPPSPSTRSINGYSSNITLQEPEHSQDGLEGEALANLGLKPVKYSLSSPLQSIPQAELIANKRYPQYWRGEDIENAYALDQSWYSQLGNAAVKFAATTVGTFAQGFNTIPSTISAAKNSSISELSGEDTYEGDVDKWLKNLEDYFPNYYTRYEKEHPFQAMLPFAPGFTNFIGDKVIKNLGFTAGAIANAVVTDAVIGAVTGGIGEIPLIGAQIGKISLRLNKLFATANKFDKVEALAKSLGKTVDLNTIAGLAAMEKFSSGTRYALGMYGASRTEAAVEARDSFERVKQSLIDDYKYQNFGEDPSLEELKTIEKYAEDAMNARFGVNMALLTVSNTVQFGNLFKSFNKSAQTLASKSLDDIGGVALKKGSLDTFERKTAENLSGRVWDSVKPTVTNLITEGVYEEGGQYATEKGVNDYYTRKYTNLKNQNNRKTWDSLNETISSTTKGLKDQFGSSEGLENMLVGAITAMISGKVSSSIEKVKGTDTDTKRNSAINILNTYGISSTLQQQYKDTLTSANIAKEMEEAVASGDVYKYKNLKSDMLFNFVMSRIPSGMHDVTIEQLSMLKDLSKEEFEKTFGMSFEDSNKKTVDSYVNSLIEEANNINKNAQAINATFRNPFKKVIDPKNPEEELEAKKYNKFNEWKTNLIYYSSTTKQINNRLTSIQESLSKINPQIPLDTVSSLMTKEGLKELSKSYEKQAVALSEQIIEGLSKEERKVLRDQIKNLRTLSEKANFVIENGHNINTYNQLLNFELSNNDSTKENVVGIQDTKAIMDLAADSAMLNTDKEKAAKIFDSLSSEEGFNKFFNQKDEEMPEVAETIGESEFINKEGVKEKIELGRGYLFEKPREAKVNKIADDRWEVISPYGESSFHKTEEAANLTAKEQLEDSKDLSRVVVLGINPDGTVKVEAADGNIFNISKDKLAGYEKIETEQEKLRKKKGEVDKDLEDVENESGDNPTGDPDYDIELTEEHEKRKATHILFKATSSTTEGSNKAMTPHNLRSIQFFNNAKNFENRSLLRAIVITAKQAKDLNLLEVFALQLGMSKDQIESEDFKAQIESEAFKAQTENINNGLILAMYTMQVGKDLYFVNEKGKQLSKVGDPIDANLVVFSAMSNTSISYPDGKTARYREGQKEAATQQALAWKAKREAMLAAPSYEVHTFSISRGIPEVKDPKAKNSVIDNLVPKNKVSTQEGLIQIPTTGKISHMGELLKFPNGRPVLSYGDTLVFLNNRTFSSEESKSIFAVIKSISEDIQSKQSSGKNVKINRSHLKFLQSVLFYAKDSKGAANNIYIDTATMDFVLGSKRYDITKIGQFEKEITDTLKTTFNSVNNYALTKAFSEKFTEFYVENDVLKSKEWVNYQTYLLSGTNPLLSTNIDKPTEATPYNFVQKYAILQGIDFPAIPSKPNPAKKEEPKKKEEPVKVETNENLVTTFLSIKIGDEISKGTLVLDEKEEVFTYTLKSGKTVNFTLDEKGVAVVEPNEATKELSKDEKILNSVIIPTLEKLGKYKKPETEIKVEKQPVSDIEAKKADIERRRQEKLNNIPKRKLYEEALQRDKEELERTGKKDTRASSALSTMLKKDEDKINAKYDAELAALESKPVEPATIVVDKGKALGKIKNINNKAGKVVGPLPFEKMTSDDLVEFKKWMAKNLPNIPFEVLQQLISINSTRKAFGAFDKGVVKFFTSAARGTEYHEAFEAIWHSFLTEDEQNAILKEFKSNKGSFLDLESGKRIDYNLATDQQAKERIADDFGDFRLGKLPSRSLGQKILDFFKRVINYFKTFGANKKLKDELFKKINEGGFKQLTIPDDVKLKPAAYKPIPGLSEKQAFELVQDITARFFQIVFGSNLSLYEIESLTGEDTFGAIKEVYSEVDPEQGYSRMDILGEEAYNDLVDRAKDFLKTFKIDFTEEDRISINDENVNNRDYAAEAFATNWKKYSPYPVKILIGTLTKAQYLNQKGKDNLEMPDVDSSDLGYKLFNFSRAFATLMDKLSGTTDPTSLKDKLVELAKSDSNYVRLFSRLKGDLNNLEFKFSEFEPHDWRLFVQFYQTFTKQKPDAYIQYVTEKEVYSQSANLSRPIDSLKSSWMNKAKELAKDKKNSIIRFDSEDKVYKVTGLSEIEIKRPDQMISFLEKLGVEFPIQVYNALNDSENKKENQKTQFSEIVSAIHSKLSKTENLFSLSGKILDIDGRLSQLAALYVKATNPIFDMAYVGIENKKMQSYANSNALSVLESEFNSSNTLKELLLKRPELNDVFSITSQILKKGGLFFNEEGVRIKDIKLGYTQGTINVTTNKEKSTQRLGLGDRLVQEINQNLNGNYYVLVPADSSTEWMLNLGNNISFKDIEGNTFDNVYKIFAGYLSDEIRLALADRSHLDNVSTKSKELRFFKDILPKDMVETLHSLINKNATLKEINAYFEKEETWNKFTDAIFDFINETVEETTGLLMSNNQIVPSGEGRYSFNMLDSDFAKNNGLDKNNLDDLEIANILFFTNANYIINNIEMHKVIFGDPYQFAVKDGKLDETKRIKSFLSPRLLTFDSPEINTFLNQKYNKAGEIDLKEGDPGYHINKSYANTVTLEDVNIHGKLSSEIPAYAKTNEADASSIISLPAYREVKFKNGQWDLNGLEEKWYQWEMAFARQNMPGYKYTNTSLEKHDKALVKTFRPKFTLEILKPIVSGNKENKKHIELVLDKFSQMPLVYSAVKGRALESLFIKMTNENIDYVVFESGRKVGSEGKHKLYTEDGKFNEKPFNNLVQVPWKAYGIQVENSYDGPKQQTRGSQITKLFSLDLFENGKAITPEAEVEYKRNVSILNKIHENNYKELLDRLGIEDLGDSFKLEDYVKVAELLQKEMLRREVPENVKDVLRLDENGQFVIPFESSAAYVQIKNLLYSLIDDALQSPTMPGGAHVQATSTLWEDSSKGREVVTINGKKVFTSSALKFYEDKDGLRYCEVMIPCWFKDSLPKGKFKTDADLIKYLNSEEGKSILTGIGFRIPTQAMSSIDVFVVKDFLPSYMGKTVVVPSEITTKAGSDFDIDKLNMYLKSVYTDAKGDIKLVTLKGTEEETKAFYKNVYENTIQKSIEKLERFELFRGDIIRVFSTIEGIEDRSSLTEDDLESILGEQDFNFYQKHRDILGEISNQAYEENLLPSDYIRLQVQELGKSKEKLSAKLLNEELKAKYIKGMYKKALENEYYDSLIKMISLPENFKRLVAPVDKAGLDVVAEELNALRGINENNVKGRLVNRNFLTKLRHLFLTGKRWVGIAAINITGHSMFQKSQVYIDNKNLKNLKGIDRILLGDMSIILPHNTVVINGEPKISMSGVKTADGKYYISDRLSGYATGFVDIAKDPFILSVIQSNFTIGTFMFLERVGAGNSAAYFLNQPIIAEYVKMLDAKNATWLYNQSNINDIYAKFPTTDEAMEEAEIDLGALKDNIKRYYENLGFTSNVDNAVQRKIFTEFLKYSRMADFNFKLTQATNYDTARISDANVLYRMALRTNNARTKNIFSSVDNILKSTFLGPQARLIFRASDSLGTVLKLDRYEIRNKIINPILKEFADDDYLSNDEYVNIGNKIIMSFLDYAIQTKSNPKLNTRIKDLLLGANSVASMLEEAQENFPEIAILNDLEVVSSPRWEGAKSVRLKANLQEAYDVNRYVEMMKELQENPETSDLYDSLVQLSILQGTAKTPISINNVIPVEDRAEYITSIVNTLNIDQDLENFAKNGKFQRNAWKDNDIVPVCKPNSYEKGLVNIDQFGNNMNRYEIFAFRSPKLASLGTTYSDRKFLFLSEKYSAKDIQNDFIKIARIQEKGGEKFDLKTGVTITGANFSARKKKGDMSLQDYYGYEKVKYPDGTPVTYIQKSDDGQETIYIYKQINLLGDGMFATEHYEDNRPSVIDNGTVKVEEMSNDQIISLLESEIQETLKVEPVTSASSAPVIESPGSEIYSKLGNKTQSKNVEIPGIGDLKDVTYSGKTFWGEVVPEAKAQFGDQIIIAYRGNRKKTFAENFKSNGVIKVPVTIGNPFDWQNETGERDEQGIKSTKKFIHWMTTGDAMGNTEATPEYRKAIIDNIKSGELKGRPIIYYQEKGYATHATALDYLINKYDWNQQSVSTQPTSTIEVVSRYTNQDVKANPNKIYVFGDNTQRVGTGGQAQIRNNSNAMGIATKLAPSNEESAFMTDKDLAKNKAIIDGDIAKIKATGKPVVFPKDGFGTGLAKLKEKAPQTYAYLKQRLLDEFGFDNDNGTVKVNTTLPAKGDKITINTSDSNFQQEIKDISFKNGILQILYVNNYGVEITLKGKYDGAGKFFPEERKIWPKPFSKISTASYIDVDLISPNITDITESFKEFGTEYRFTTQNGKVISGEFKQGGKPWETMNPKNVSSKYQELKDKKQSTNPFADRLEILKKAGIDVLQDSNDKFYDVVGADGVIAERIESLEEAILTAEQSLKVEAVPVVKEEPSNKGTFSHNGRSIQTDFVLTKSQDKALKELMDFLNSKEKFITLQGAAGTGKTSVIGYLQKIMKEYGFVYMAPTHAATVELAFATVKIGNKSLPMTVASGIKQVIDPFTKNKVGAMSKKLQDRLALMNNVIVVDEISMLSTKDYNSFKQIMEKQNIKVIFMGDMIQIPEVDNKNPEKKLVSKAFTDNKQLLLTEVKRTSSSTILEVLENIRKNRNGKIPLIEGSQELYYLNASDFDNQLAKAVLKDPENTTIISYSNSSVKSKNLKIRQALGRIGSPVKEDIILGYGGYNSKQVEKQDIANSVRYVISSVIKDGSVYVISAKSSRLKYLEQQGLPVKETATAHYYQLSEKDSFKFEDLTEKDFENNNKIISEQFKKLYEANKEAKNFPSGANWARFFSVQERVAKFFELVNLGGEYVYNPSSNKMEEYDYTEHKDIVDTYPTLKIEKGVDYGHAITIHKSQGSTIKNVFFDANTLPKGESSKLFQGGVQIGTEKHSLLYVGMSRASQILVVNKENPEHFYVPEVENKPEEGTTEIPDCI